VQRRGYVKLGGGTCTREERAEGGGGGKGSQIIALNTGGGLDDRLRGGVRSHKRNGNNRTEAERKGSGKGESSNLV